LDLLARREHSRTELEQKLARKGASADQLLQVIGQLIDADLQSDQRFCENYLRYRLQSGFGPLRIRAELQQRGVSDQLVRQQLALMEGHWLAVLTELFQRKSGDDDPPDYKEKTRRQRFLAQRGFSFDQIKSVVE